jgi:hypothetical protein
LYRQYAAKHLLRALLERHPERRAFFQQAQRVNITAHRLVLAHPFFWSAEKSQLFLHELGNHVNSVAAIFQAFAAIVERSITTTSVRDAERNNWFLELPENFRSDLNETDAKLFASLAKQTNPLFLLRFIRDQLTRKNDPSYPPLLREQLEARPWLLEVYPHLVCDCWMWIIENIAAVDMPSSLMQYLEPYRAVAPHNNGQAGWNL